MYSEIKLNIEEENKFEKFFKGNADYLETFNAIRSYLEALGVVNIKVSKTQISFNTLKQFAWVWLPPFKIKGRPKKYVILSFGTGYEIRDPRIVKAVEPYPGRWTHHVILKNSSDIDEQIYTWLKTAYEFSLKRKHN